MSIYRQESFVYNGDKVPVGGEPGTVLMKSGSPNYYTAWRTLSHIFSDYDVVLDEGEY